MTLSTAPCYSAIHRCEAADEAAIVMGVFGDRSGCGNGRPEQG